MSKQEPDMTIVRTTFYQPAVVFESGWSEPREKLYSEAESWLKSHRRDYQEGGFYQGGRKISLLKPRERE